MTKFFKESTERLYSHVVGMTQYYTCNFEDPQSPRYIATHDITSCVVVLLKNITAEKQCTAFGMMHLNYTNVVFPEQREENLAVFLNAFQQVGGDLTRASIQVLGGQYNDPNQVTDKVVSGLKKVLQQMGVQGANVKVLEQWQNHITLQTSSTEVMSIACDKKGTYLRKVSFKGQERVAIQLYPEGCELLADANIKNIICSNAQIDQQLKRKTNFFLLNLDRLLQQINHAYLRVHPGNLYKDSFYLHVNALIQKHSELEWVNVLKQGCCSVEFSGQDTASATCFLDSSKVTA